MKNTNKKLLTAEDIMHTPVTVDKDATIREAAKVMDEHNIGSILVEDKGHIIGISTEDDMFVAIEREINPDMRKISDIMTRVVHTIEFDTGIDKISEYFSKRHTRRLGVIKNAKIVGVFTSRELVKHYADLLIAAQDVMHDVNILTPEHTIYDAVAAMDVESDTVLIRDDNTMNIITEKDIVKAIAKGLPADTAVSAIMRKATHTINYDDDINEAWKIFSEFKIRRLPVMKDGDVIGIITTRDLLKPYHSALVKAKDVMWTNVPVISNDSTIRDAINSIDKESGCVLIGNVSTYAQDVSEAVIQGIVTERDVLRAIARNIDLNSNVSEIMSKMTHTIDADAGINEVLENFLKYSIRRLPVTCEGDIVGILTIRDIIWPYHLHRMMAEHIMSPAVKASDGRSIKEVADIMFSENIGSILIVKDDDLAGIVTESDMLRVIEGGIDPESSVSQVMNTTVRTAEYDTELEQLSKIFYDRHVRRIPITKTGDVVGIVTANELLFRK